MSQAENSELVSPSNSLWSASNRVISNVSPNFTGKVFIGGDTSIMKIS